MSILTSNLAIKILAGAAIVVGIVAIVEHPGDGTTPCATIEHYPGRSAVYECPKGLSTVYLWNNTGKKTYATVTTDVAAQAWLTVTGDAETLKTLPVKLGAPVILGPGAFMAVDNGSGLIYVYSKNKYILSVAWDHASNR